MLVKFAVDGGGVDFYVGVRLVQGVDAHRRGEQAHEFDGLGFALLDARNRRYR